MENREQQILSEIKVMVASIRTQLQQLDSKMMELQMTVDPENSQAKPIDIDMDDMDMIGMPVTVAVQDDLPFVDTTDVVDTEDVSEVVEVAEPVAEAEHVAEAEPVVEVEPVVEIEADDLPADEPVDQPAEVTVVEPAEVPVVELEPVSAAVPETVPEEDDDMPLFAEPQPLFEAALNSPKAKKAVIDVMTDKQAWRTDLAGSPVRDLLSAISLNDRVHFIKTLFRDDAVLFQQTRAKINAMSSLDEVVDYITANFDWDMSSQVVYRFMMAVRRKVQA